MDSSSTSPTHRAAFLAQLVQQDPANPLLLADAAAAALGAGALEDAERLIDAGSRLEPGAPAWQFRLASLRIAQRRLTEAQTLLEALQPNDGPHPTVVHNLAYTRLLQADFRACADMLAPWVEKGQAPPAMQVLWLRACHQLAEVPEALEWVDRQLEKGAIAPAVAGVAALLAVDDSRLKVAERLAATALQADPDHTEAQLALASVRMGQGRLDIARPLLQALIQKEPHQARAWSTLGFVELLAGTPEAARAHLERALALAPDDGGTWLGMGWACVVAQDLGAAMDAFRRALALEPESEEGHGGLAVVLAMQGQRSASEAHVEQARKLRRGSISARYAKALNTGRTGGLQPVQRLAQKLISGLNNRRTDAHAIQPPREAD